MLFVHFTTGHRGRTLQDISLAKCLVSHGHQAVIYSLRPSTSEFEICNRYRISFHRYLSDELDTLLELWKGTGKKPDVILCNSELYFEQLWALAQNIPVFSLTDQISPDWVSGIPPLVSSRLPNSSTRLSAHISWRKFHRDRKANPAYRHVINSVRELATRLKLDFEKVASISHWEAIRFNDVPQLCLNAIEFDFPSAGSRTSKYVGSLLEMQVENKIDKQLENWIKKGVHSPLVYCSFGSMFGSEKAIRNAIVVAESKPDWRWLISTFSIPQSKRSNIKSAQDNILILEDIPQSYVLKHADVMISGAGIYSINECIFSQTPMLIHSLGVHDQNGNAARVEYHGLGMRMDLEKASSQSVNNALEQLIEENITQKERLSTMHRNYLTYIDQHIAVKTILDTIQRQS